MRKHSQDCLTTSAEGALRMTLRPTFVEIDLDAIVSNVRALKSAVGRATEVVAVVKADAYGHGALRVAQEALGAGASRLAVAIPEEGVELRRAGIGAPIMVLGMLFPEQACAVVEYDLSPAVSSAEDARYVSREACDAKKTIPVHIKLDTGMTRTGTDVESVVSLARSIAAMPGVRLEGLFTHFAAADEPDKGYTEKQASLFRQAVVLLRASGIEIPFLHASNTAGALSVPDARFDAVRTGIALYGLYPSDDVPREIRLTPAMSWKTRLGSLRTVPEGTYVGYGCTFKTERESRIGTLPVGYADGYSRHLSNKGEVLIRGKRARVVGRVCMDMTMIDVTDVPDAAVGDEVVLMGRQGEECISAEMLAGWIGTINYEVVCRVGKRVPRVYCQGGKSVGLESPFGG